MKFYEHPDVLGAQRILRPNSTDLALSALVSGDAYSRWTLDSAGKMSWGPGNAALDLTAERYWDGSKLWLKIAPNLQAGDLAITTLNVGNNALSVNISGQITAGTWMGTVIGPTYGGVTYVTPTGTPVGLTNSAGSASSAWRSDCALALDQAIAPTWTNRHWFDRAATTSLAIGTCVTGDSYNRLEIACGGKLTWGTGAAAGDVYLYRSNTNELEVEGKLLVSSLLTVGSAVGFVVHDNGVVSSGVWQATEIGAIYGGTGQTAVTAGDLLYGSATNTWSRRAKGTDGQVLTLVSGLPAWASLGTPFTCYTPRQTITVTWQGSGTVNNLLVPTTGTYFRVVWSDAGTHDMSITGMQNGSDGRQILIENGFCDSSTGRLEFLTESSSSTAANRIRERSLQTTADVQIFSCGVLLFIYDPDVSRWLPVRPVSIS